MNYYLVLKADSTLGVRSEVQLKWDRSMGFIVTIISEFPTQTSAVAAHAQAKGEHHVSV